MTKIINLTAESVRLLVNGGHRLLIFKAAETPVHINYQYIRDEQPIKYLSNSIPVFRLHPGIITNLPDYNPHIAYIVTKSIAHLLSHRPDLYYPIEHIYNHRTSVKAYKALATVYDGPTIDLSIVE